jgi:arginyl-tRNA synthetase
MRATAHELGKEIVDELIAKGIADDERPAGPVIVKIDEKLGLTKEKYRTMVILRSDGTALYSTNDLALAKQKFEQYHVDRSIYVVDFRQSLHFQQVFKILELWGFPQAAKCYHLSYGYVTLPEGAMSARRGRVALFKEVYDEAVKRVLALEPSEAGNIPEMSVSGSLSRSAWVRWCTPCCRWITTRISSSISTRRYPSMDERVPTSKTRM